MRNFLRSVLLEKSLYPEERKTIAKALIETCTAQNVPTPSRELAAYTLEHLLNYDYSEPSGGKPSLSQA